MGSNSELEKLVNDAQQLVQGDSEALTKTLRKDQTQRDTYRAALEDLGTKLSAAVVVKGRKLALLDDLDAE